MITNEDIKSDYPWINNELFHRLLVKEHPKEDSIEIVNITAKAALANGENYGSQMIRVNVTYRINENKEMEFPVVIKAPLADKKLREMMDNFGIFHRETKMYGDIMSDVQRVLLEINDKSELAPRCYEANHTESYLIFEDLTARNYRNASRFKGLDFEHQKLVMSKIAKWHATTAFLLSQNIKFPDFEKHPMDYSPMWNDIVNNSIKSATTATSRKIDFVHISKKLEKLQENLLEKLRKSISCDDEQTFITLCHGDLWSNNIMFKYNDAGQPIDAILLDYQISFIGPAILDVSNVLFSASSEELQDRDWDLLIQFYHQELKDTLERLQYSKRIPSLIEIHMQFLSRSICCVPLGLLAVCGRIIEVDDEDKNDVTKFESEEYGIRIFENPKCKKMLEFLLDFFYRKGILD